MCTVGPGFSNLLLCGGLREKGVAEGGVPFPIRNAVTYGCQPQRVSAREPELHSTAETCFLGTTWSGTEEWEPGGGERRGDSPLFSASGCRQRQSPGSTGWGVLGVSLTWGTLPCLWHSSSCENSVSAVGRAGACPGSDHLRQSGCADPSASASQPRPCVCPRKQGHGPLGP